MKLPEAQARRLVQILGMLGSNADGEVVNAARKADRMLREAKLSWAELLNGETEKKWSDHDMDAAIKLAFKNGYNAAKEDARDLAPTNRQPASFAAFALVMVRQYSNALSEWETEFCEDWTAKSYPPSAKQRAIFERLAERTGVPMPRA